MSFRSELKKVLELEREGEARLAAAREEARRIEDDARQEAHRLLQAKEKHIALERERRLREAEEEIGRDLQERRQRYLDEANRLHDLAENRREEAVTRILLWLREET